MGETDSVAGNPHLPRSIYTVARAWLAIQLSRRINLIPENIQRLLNGSPSLGSAANIGLSLAGSDLLTSVAHGMAMRFMSALFAPSNSATKTTITVAAANTAIAMYDSNPLNLVAALGIQGRRSAATNAFVLLLARIATKIPTDAREKNHSKRTPRASRIRLTHVTNKYLNNSLIHHLVHLVPAVALLADAVLHPPSATLHPSLSLRWYLNAELFPSFRHYFASGISVMGALLSAGVALSCAGKFDGRGEGRRTAHILAIQAMLWELFATSSSPAVSALWQSCVVGIAETPREAIRTQLYVMLYVMATLMNVAAYQLWIGDNVGNANFFYGMNLLRAAGVCAWVYGLVKHLRCVDQKSRKTPA